MNTHQDDEILFSHEEHTTSPAPVGLSSVSPWRVLVVDDDEQLHAVTRMVLKGLVFRGRAVEVVAVHSGRAAIDLLSSSDDFALVLLDVVMETDKAGLETVDIIREKLENRDIRIVLRTGEPGLAPEREVISRYDIDGYEAKSTLTAQKLHTVVIGALRTYDHIRAIQAQRRGLERVIGATATLVQARALDRFAEGVLSQLEALVCGGSSGIFCTHIETTSRPDAHAIESCEILAGSGAFATQRGRRLGELPIAETVVPALARSLGEARPVAVPGGVAMAALTPHGKLALSWVACADPGDLELRLVAHFCVNLSGAFDAVRDLARLDAQNAALTRILAASVGLEPATPLDAIVTALEASRLPAELVAPLRKVAS